MSTRIPNECSDQILEAPARADLDPYREGYWKEVDGKPVWVSVPYRSGCAGIVRDVFDDMTDQTARRRGTAPFTAAQVGAGREYRALHERVASAGIKCASTFDTQRGGGGKVDFMDIYMADSQRLGWFHAAIGDGVAKDIRRKVPARQEGVVIGEVQLRQIGRKLITVRGLVDAVCLADRSLSAVLSGNGWRPTGKNRIILRAALSAALERMQGI